MSLRDLHDRLAWPSSEGILSPSGAGPRVLVDLAREKIESAIKRHIGGSPPVRVGLLTRNPNSVDTEAPIAVVCEFEKAVRMETLAFAHRLAWNFARSPLLITVEPHVVRSWSCCDPPAEKSTLFQEGLSAEIVPARFELTRDHSASEQAAHALHWVRLATGDFYRMFPDRFRRDGRADRVLLEELKAVRRLLKAQRLADDTIHDLLARVVFIQFLFDRTDADGRPAINTTLLARLREEGHLKQEHQAQNSILADHAEAYRFFRWLNEKFNGDLFPGKGATEAEREAEWRSEMERVKPWHLKTLADFVEGKVHGRQRVFWRQYAFDVIPLDFVSSIYEEFVTATGAHYTPGFLVDFMLDGVLSWDGTEWDLTVLDPACGSGIFLVKAYQRLIQRWKNANPGEKPSTALLRGLLERNLFGVDVDEHAVRAASFSLYLTMCDEIDPKSYLKNTRFPRLRERRLIHADFFQEDCTGFSTKRDGPSYDLVVGNAPWGEETATDAARDWAGNAKPKWLLPDKGIGTLFLAKTATLTKVDGRICMIQPAGSLLFNRSGLANQFRKRLFSQFKVEEVVNLSTLRFDLFEGATSPPCIVTMRPVVPDGEPLQYISPKRVLLAHYGESESSYAIVIDPGDISQIWPNEAATEPFAWTTLAWGGRRDLALIRQLSESMSLARLVGRRFSREGIIRGKLRYTDIVGWHILEMDDFPAGTLLRMQVNRLPVNTDPCVHRRTALDAFRTPQLLIKQGWTAGSQRFRAAICESDSDRGALCSQSYLSVHLSSENEEWLDSAVLSYNSCVALYFLLLTSGRLASYRPEPLVEEIRSVPLPLPKKGMLTGISSVGDIDERAREAFEFKDAEWTLIRDLVDYTMPDFKGDATSPGRQSTTRKPSAKRPSTIEPQLFEYCRYFLRVLKAGFGEDKAICATIYQDAAEVLLPVRLVAIHFDWPRDDEIVVESIQSGELCRRLSELDEKFLKSGDDRRGGIYFQRVARIYDEFLHRGRRIPTLYLVKPDRVRYWTRSAGLRDADEVAGDLQLWLSDSQRAPQESLA